MPVQYTLSPSDFSVLCKVVDRVARSRGLRPAQAEDFAQWVHLTLLERNYAPLARFAGRSSLQTYLTVVVRRLLIDWRNAEQGKWRPSAWARDTGGIAIDLDRLIRRDGHSVDEAMAILQQRPDCPAPVLLRDLLQQLPRRVRRREVPYEEGKVHAASAFQDPIETQQASIAKRHLLRLLRRAFQQLPPADRDLLRLRFGQNLPVVSIACRLGVPAKGLYRRIDRVVASLRPAVLGGARAQPSFGEVSSLH
jgi:RNA polymerase sigma factor (sigma-70 family)